MGRNVVVVAAVTAAACLASGAFGQAIESVPLLKSPATSAVVSARLENMGVQLLQKNATGPRAATYDAAWPHGPDEYRALGANMVLLVSAVSKDEGEFPMRVYVQAGDQTVALKRLTAHRSEVAGGSAIASAVGTHREDEFYLLPGTLALGAGAILIDFAANRQAFHLAQLPFRRPPSLEGHLNDASSDADPAALKAMAIREFPGIAEGRP